MEWVSRYRTNHHYKQKVKPKHKNKIQLPIHEADNWTSVNTIRTIQNPAICRVRGRVNGSDLITWIDIGQLIQSIGHQPL